MNTKMIIGLVVLLVVIILGAILVAVPAPSTGADVPEPFASDMVKVSTPLPSTAVAPGFTVKGYARGMWFFEASFPVEVRDPSGHKIGGGIAQADGDWMTEEFVPFTAPIVVTGYTGPATLVLIKDNPSGLPEHDDSVEFAIVIE